MLRELNYLKELYSKSPWAEHFSELLCKALKLHRSLKINNISDTEKQRHRIMQRFDELLAEPPDTDNKKTYPFFKRILRNRDHIFVFLKDLAAPPHNNSSERAIPARTEKARSGGRNIKVKQKVSGQFKADNAAMDFAKIRSAIDTTIKNSQNVLIDLKLIARNELSLEEV